MVDKQLIGVRLSPEMIERIDAIASVFSARSAGIQVNRSEVVRLALDHGISHLERDTKSATRKPKK